MVAEELMSVQVWPLHQLPAEEEACVATGHVEAAESSDHAVCVHTRADRFQPGDGEGTRKSDKIMR